MNGIDGPCARVRGRLERGLDGALPPLEAARDAGHLEACASCAADLAALDAARREAARALGAAVDPAWLNAGLAARLAAAAPPRRRALERVLGPSGDRAGAPVLVAAAALLALTALSSLGALDGLGEAVRRGAPSLDGLHGVWPDLERVEWPLSPAGAAAGGAGAAGAAGEGGR